MHCDERVDPASVGAGDEEVAAVTGQVLLAGRPDLEAEHAEQQQAGDQANHPVQVRGPCLRRAAQPLEALPGSTAGGRERLRPDPRAGTLLGRR